MSSRVGYVYRNRVFGEGRLRLLASLARPIIDTSAHQFDGMSEDTESDAREKVILGTVESNTPDQSVP
jgi:hypothetical protein